MVLVPAFASVTAPDRDLEHQRRPLYCSILLKNVSRGEKYFSTRNIFQSNSGVDVGVPDPDLRKRKSQSGVSCIESTKRYILHLYTGY